MKSADAWFTNELQIDYVSGYHFSSPINIHQSTLEIMS